MEQYITLSTPDGFEIPCVLNSQKKSQKCIIFVHWLTGSMTEAHFYAAKEYFTSIWYDTLRFNLYAGGEKCRQLQESTIMNHSQDIETVLEYFSQSYTSLYLVGHSLGWPSIIRVQKFPQNLQKIIYWDPAFDTSSTSLRCFEKNGIWFFYPNNGKNIEMNISMIQELQENKHKIILQNMTFPVAHMSIIYASEARHKDNKPFTDGNNITSCIISWAGHGFSQEGKYQELFEKTLEYIEA